MSNFEFISYKSYPNDQYTKGIATVRIDRKYVVRYAEKPTKTGGVFWAPATHSFTENGEKKYEVGFMLDSRMDEESILDFIRSHVAAIQRAKSVHPQNAQNTQPMPSYGDQFASDQEAALTQGEIPF